MNARAAELAKEIYTRDYQGSVGLTVPAFVEDKGFGINIPDVTRPMRLYFNELAFLDTVKPEVTSPDSKIAAEKSRLPLMDAFQDWNFKASDLNFARSQLKDQSEYKFDPTHRMSGETKYGVSPSEMAEISSSIDKYKQAYDVAMERVRLANAALDKSLTGFRDLRDQALKTAIDGEWFVVKCQRCDNQLLKAAKGSCDVLTEAFQLAHQYKYHIDVKCDPATMQLSFDRPNRGARPTTMC